MHGPGIAWEDTVRYRVIAERCTDGAKRVPSRSGGDRFSLSLTGSKILKEGVSGANKDSPGRILIRRYRGSPTRDGTAARSGG